MADEDKKNEAEVREAEGEEVEIRDTDIVFDCPYCGKNLAIDYRGAGLQINCSECGKEVLVPIPDGMQLTDLDLDPGEILKQLFATRRNFQKSEQVIQSLKAKLVQMQEALGAMQNVVEEGLAEE
ncbi:MAG: hypothetical protein IJI73_06930 [Kiritimatiellae bacterium]|nr:hypothetical protein [Kiritimatiellia bacterium]